MSRPSAPDSAKRIPPSVPQVPGTSACGVRISRSSTRFPSIGLEKRSRDPPRFAAKTIRWPSALQMGEVPPSNVNCARRLPAIS